MPGPVAGQRRLLESLITATAGREQAFRWLELGGSAGPAAAGDELSDIDAGLGIADDAQLGRGPRGRGCRRCGRVSLVTDSFRQRFPGKDEHA